MKYTFCNTGNCFDFDPKQSIIPYPTKPPVEALVYYQDRVDHAKNKAVYIMDETGKIIYR